MNWYLQAMESLLSADDRALLGQISAPTVVAVQPDESYCQSCVMADGEIRLYGYKIGRAKGQPNGGYGYLYSRDCGLSWKQKYADERWMGPASYNPQSGRWVHFRWDDGIELRLSDIGPDDPSPRTKRPFPKESYYGCMKIPFMLREKPTRWVCTCHRDTSENGRDNFLPVFLYSDDDGETWQTVEMPIADNSETIYPDKGSRWLNRGSEPTVAELADGTLLLLSRTSGDHMNAYYSHDHGETWEGGEPYGLHGTLTTPVFHNLSDGRVLLMWNNTNPMPKHNHLSEFPMTHHGHILGNNEDAFTNRDVCHAAVTTDGRSWVGQREALRTSIRNAADYRRAGGRYNIGDKSLQQFEIWELPFNRVLVLAGQSIAARRVFIFNLDWLYETELCENFQSGLDHVSSFQYLKSLSGSRFGHCSWNRTSGAAMMPDPEDGIREVAQLCRYHDTRLYNEKQGLVWNFPAAVTGDVEMEIRIEGAGVLVSLSDVWLNPSDPSIALRQPLHFTLEATDLPPCVWNTVLIRYNSLEGTAVILQKDKDHAEVVLFEARFRRPVPFGISYLHLQSLAEEPDARGTYIRSLSMKAATPCSLSDGGRKEQ